MSYYKSDDGVKIFYRLLNKNSKKTTIIFVHGWICNWTCFKREIEFFKSNDYPVLYLDLRGHGLSDKPEAKEKYHLDLMVSDIYEIIKKENIKKINFVGHSMGGMIASLFAYKYDKLLNSLIIIDSSYENPLFSNKIIYFYKHKIFARHICNYIIKHTHQKHLGNLNKKEFDISKIKTKNDIIMTLNIMIHASMHTAFTSIEAMFKYNLRGKLKNIKTPTLIIGSNHDQLFSKRTEKYFKKQIPNSKLIMEEGAHLIIIKKPEEISKQISLFLDKVEKYNKSKVKK